MTTKCATARKSRLATPNFFHVHTRNAGPNSFAQKSLWPLRGRKAAPMEPNFSQYKQFKKVIVRRYPYHRNIRANISAGAFGIAARVPPPDDHAQHDVYMRVSICA